MNYCICPKESEGQMGKQFGQGNRETPITERPGIIAKPKFQMKSAVTQHHVERFSRRKKDMFGILYNKAAAPIVCDEREEDILSCLGLRNPKISVLPN